MRTDRALGWLDTGILLGWHASIVAFALLDWPALAALVVVIGVAAFWVAVWQLVTETGRRVRTAVRDFGDEFAGVREEMRQQSPSVQVGEVIVIQPADETSSRS